MARRGGWQGGGGDGKAGGVMARRGGYGKGGRMLPPPPHPRTTRSHQADADGAVPVGWGEDVALGPGHPLMQAACKAGGCQGGATPGSEAWRGGWWWWSRAHLRSWGSSPRPGRAAGGSRPRSRSRSRRALVPPAKARSGSALTPGWHGGARRGGDGVPTWQEQLWHPGSVQRAPGSRGTPRYQQRGADGAEVPGAATARGDGSVAGGCGAGEEEGSWVPGGAAGRWGEGEPLGTRRGPPEPGGSRTSVGGCCRDCRMGDGARMDLG